MMAEVGMALRAAGLNISFVQIISIRKYKIVCRIVMCCLYMFIAPQHKLIHC